MTDPRDADGWVSSVELSRVLGRPARDAARLVRRRIGIVEKQRIYKPSAHTLYRLTDEQWAEVVSFGEEIAIVGRDARKGWHRSDSCCEDSDPVIWLWFLVDNVGYPVGWQWREDSERAYVAPSVLSLREAIDQLLGQHPVSLSWRPRYQDQIKMIGHK